MPYCDGQAKATTPKRKIQMKPSSSFHKSNLGSFGDSLPCDRDGYVHTTITGWMGAPRDGLDDSTASERRDWAREHAKAAREALARANAGLAKWRKES